MGKTTLRLVDFPGTPQTVVVVGRPLVKKGDPDEPALLVFNQVLGGMFSSRLNLNLREAKGWTYGAWSAVDPRAGVGPFQAGAGIKTEHTADAVAEVFKEFDALKSAGVKGEAELNAAKANYVKSLPGRFETLGDLASAASWIFIYDLPLDYYASLPERISAVTADDVKRVAERALVKDDMAIILVGDKAAIEADVKNLGLGELEVVDAHGQPLN
jgi:zinc protease